MNVTPATDIAKANGATQAVAPARGAIIATDFLREYFRGTKGDTYLGVIRNSDSKLERGPVAHLMTRNPGEVAKFVATHDKPELECAIYYCTATIRDGHTKREAADCWQFPSLFADCDDNNHELDRGSVIELLEALPCPPTLIVDSGHGLQPHWLLAVASEDAERVIAARKKLLAIIASDAVHDAPRFMRLPGSHNSKRGGWLPVTLVSDHAGLRYTLEALEKWLETAEIIIPRKAVAKPNGGGKPFMLPPSAGPGTDHTRGAAWASVALEESARELADVTEAGHNMLLAKACRMGTMVARGWIDVHEVYRALLAASEACGLIKARGRKHFEDTFADGIKHGMAMPHSDLPTDHPRDQSHREDDAPSDEPDAGGQGGESEVPAVIIKSSKEFVAGFVPPDYAVVGLLQRRFFYSLTGQTGAGKTAIMLLLSACAALGRPFAGREIKQLRVLYLAAENADDVRMRWIAFAQHMDFDIDAIGVYFVEGRFSLSKSLKLLQAEAKRQGGEFGLIIVDTGPTFFEGKEENENKQLGDHARQLRGLIDVIPGAPCVVANCHPVKNATADQLIPRGGGAFLAEADGNLTCAKNDSTVELHWQGKFRGPDFAPMNFMIRTVTHQDLKDSDGRLIPTVIAEHITDGAKEDIAAAGQVDEDKMLALIAADPKATQSSMAIAMGWKLHNGDPHKVKVGRCIANLKASKLIKVTRRGRYKLTPEGQKVLDGEAEE